MESLRCFMRDENRCKKILSCVLPQLCPTGIRVLTMPSIQHTKSCRVRCDLCTFRMVEWPWHYNIVLQTHFALPIVLCHYMGRPKRKWCQTHTASLYQLSCGSASHSHPAIACRALKTQMNPSSFLIKVPQVTAQIQSKGQCFCHYYPIT